MIDTHAHLDPTRRRRCSRGRGRPASSGSSPSRRRSTGAARRARARRAARRRLRRARHPSAQGRRRATPTRLDELRELLARPKAVAVGETGLDYFRDYAPARRPAAAVRGAARAGRASSASRSSSTRAPPTRTRSPRSPAFDGTVVLHCFSSPGAARAGARARLVRLVRRQRHLPEGARAARGGARACPRTGCSPRPTARTSRRSPCAAGGTSPRT